MVKKTVLEQSFQDMRTDLLKLVENLEIIKEKKQKIKVDFFKKIV